MTQTGTLPPPAAPLCVCVRRLWFVIIVVEPLLILRGFFFSVAPNETPVESFAAATFSRCTFVGRRGGHVTVLKSGPCGRLSGFVRIPLII